MLRCFAALAALLGLTAATPPYPRGASEPGTPLRAYDPGGAREPANRARGLESEVEGVDAVDVLLVVPRLALLLPRALLLLAARPIEAALTLNERHRIQPRVDAALHTDDDAAGVVPTGSFITDFGASLGVRGFHRDVFGHGESIALALDFGGSVRQRYALTLDGETFGGTPLWLRTRLEYEEEPNEPFSGIGDPETVDADTGGDLAPTAGAVETRYRRDSFSVAVGAGPTFESGGLRVRPGAHARWARLSFGPNERGGLSIEEVYDVSRLRAFEESTQIFEALGSLSLERRFGDGPGVWQLEGYGGRAVPPGELEYWRWGAETSLRLDLSREMRLLRFGAGVAGVSDDAPFFALPTLGGSRRLRGYLTDRFRDSAAFLGTVDYQWYVSTRVEGLMFGEVGRVAPSAADLFDEGRWRPSGGLGVVITSGDSALFRAVAAYGDSLRIYLSADFGGLVRLKGPTP